ncbi:MAG: MG2 domain-containing protein [Chitinophagales bacterium]
MLFRKFSAAAAFSFTSLISVTVLALATSATITLMESDGIKKIKKQFQLFQENNRQERLYIQTDKPLYKTGETLWCSVFLRDAENFRPSSQSDIIHLELINPKGTSEQQWQLIAQHGVAGADIDLAGRIGGLYKLRAWTQYQRNLGDTSYVEREVNVQQVVVPRLKMKMDFERKAYGKSDVAKALIELATNEGRPLAGKRITYTATLAGNALSTGEATTNQDGKATLSVTLPADLKTTDGLINAMIDFEGSKESISRSIPIILNEITLEFFPEGGDWVQGVRSRMAFRARNEFDKAADVSGVILDNDQPVANFRSLHMGMGAVELMPQKGHRYTAKITQPAGIETVYNLPMFLGTGYTLGVTAQGDDISVRVNAPSPEQLHLVAQQRGKIYYAGSWNAVAGSNQIGFSAASVPTGVVQLTLFDSKRIARCERLVFVHPDQHLHIAVQTDKQVYRPREKVNLAIQVTDHKGLPVSGHFAMSVADNNLLAFADDKQGNILSAMLLEPELQEKVEEPNFYFDEKEKDAVAALDQLMLTSGWRRLVWKKILSGEFNQQPQQGERAVLAGTVFKNEEGKPLSGAKVKLLPSGKTVVTDNQGRFSTGWFDITRDNQAEVSAGGFITQTFALAAYDANVSYNLYDKNRPPVYYERIPMAAGGVAIRGARAEGLKKNVMAAPVELQANLAMEDRMEKAEVVLADEAPIEKPKEQQQIVDEKEWAGADVGDLRDADLFRNDKRAKQVVVQYYRGREFPKRTFVKGETLRHDFGTTLYWNGDVATDDAGRAKVSFLTNDLLTSFNVIVEGTGDDGGVGHATHLFEVSQPFSMDTKLPAELVSGDQLLLPIFLKNTTTEAITGILRFDETPCVKLAGSFNAQITIPAKGNQAIFIPCVAAASKDTCPLHVVFEGNGIRDEMQRSVRVISRGFPANISLSGQELSKEFKFETGDVVAGSMQAKITVFPSVMNELMAGVDAILREPYGCFEQTSSTNYPNVMAMQYLRTMKVKNPELEKRAQKLLDDGYKKLVSFETKEQGYEWFGAAPAHEALTAYGLMEFEDMKQVYPGVDEQMVQRTRQLLLNKRDGNGGFKRNPRALDAFGGADDDITNAYILYALTESGQKDLQKELDAGYKIAMKSEDPYLMALVANALFNVGDQQRGDDLLRSLVKMRNAYGFWTGKKHSITRSTGDALQIETTALISLAMMKSKQTPTDALNGAIKYLVGARSGYGSFGSTQSTVLALKALTKYAEFSRRTDEAGVVTVLVDGKKVAEKAYEKGVKENIVIDHLETVITEGKHQMAVRFSGCKNALPYTANISYSTALPRSSKKCVVDLDAHWVNKTQLAVGQTIRLSATLSNTTNQGQPMSVAVLGIPAGLSAQPWQLKELMEKKAIDFYEITGNNVVCYYRALAPNDKREINLDLKAEVPGQFEAPASTAYLYYTNENKVWRRVDRISIAP